MDARVACCSLIAVALAAAPLVTAAQPAPVDPYGGATYGGAAYGSDAYGGASYGGDAYGGDAYGGARYGGDAYGGDAYGGASYGSDGYGGASYGGDAPSVAIAPVAARPRPPAVLAYDWTTGLVRLDDAGRRVVLAAPLAGRVLAHSYQPLIVDEATGRWFLTRQAKARTARTWTLVFGDHRGATGEIAGDARCGGRGPACFEVPLGFAADGDGVLTVSMHAAGFTLARYGFGQAGRQELAGKAIATRLALAPAQDRAAYVSRGGLTLIDWTARGPRPKARGEHVKIDGELDRLVVLDDALLFRRRVTGRDRKVTTTLEVLDLTTRDREVAYRPRHALEWAPLPAPARGSAFVHDCDHARGDNPCDVIEVTAAGSRAMARGVARALDVSADGRYLLVLRHPRVRAARATAWPDLVVLDLASGQDVAVYPETPADSAQFTR
jgi:hypothetical protein